MGGSQSTQSDSDAERIVLESDDESGETKITKVNVSLEDLRLFESLKNESTDNNVHLDPALISALAQDIGIDIVTEVVEEYEDDEYEEYEDDPAYYVDPVQTLSSSEIDAGMPPVSNIAGNLMEPPHFMEYSMQPEPESEALIAEENQSEPSEPEQEADPCWLVIDESPAEPEPEPEPEPVIEEIPAPEPVAEEIPAPEPVVEEIPAPEPVVEEIPAPEPVVEEIPAPEPVVEEIPAPEPVVEEIPAPESVVEEIPVPEPVVEELPLEPVPEPTPAVAEIPSVPDPCWLVIDEIPADPEPEPEIVEEVKAAEPAPVAVKPAEPAPAVGLGGLLSKAYSYISQADTAPPLPQEPVVLAPEPAVPVPEPAVPAPEPAVPVPEPVIKPAPPAAAAVPAQTVPEKLADSLFGEFKKQEVEKIIVDAKLEGARSQAKLDADVMSAALNSERARWRSKFTVIEDNLVKRRKDISLAHSEGSRIVSSKLCLPEARDSCEGDVNKVIECYSTNPSQILLCKDLTDSFDSCVSQSLRSR